MKSITNLKPDQQILYLHARLEVLSTVLEIICVDRVSNDESDLIFHGERLLSSLL